MKMFEVEVLYTQHISYAMIIDVEAESADEAWDKANDIIEEDEFLEDGVDEAGFQEVDFRSHGPDIGTISLKGGAVLTDAEVE